MKYKYCVFYIDDDNSAVQAVADTLMIALERCGINLVVFTSLEDAIGGVAEFDAEIWGRPILAIIDLWLYEKCSNTSDEDGGIKVIDAIRRRFTDCYVIIYSANVSDDSSDPVVLKLGKIGQVAIHKRDVSDGSQNIRNFIMEKIKEMGVIK